VKRYLKKPVAGALTALALMSAAGVAQATLLEVDFRTAGGFSGVAPGSPSPGTTFATAIFDDHGGSGSVTLTMNVLNNLSAGAYVNDWYFNVSSAPLTTITFVSGVAASSVDKGSNAFKADGTGGNFDFAFHFPNGNGELGQGHTSVYTLTDPGITANSFNSVSVPAPNGGGYVSALHVQGYTVNGGGQSLWVAGDPIVSSAQIPEPATLALLGLGLVGIAATRRRG
jgi:hypothetical protein